MIPRKCKAPRDSSLGALLYEDIVIHGSYEASLPAFSCRCTIQADDLYRTLDHSSGKNGTNDQDSNTDQSTGS